jgi:hypothetical protein
MPFWARFLLDDAEMLATNHFIRTNPAISGTAV